MDLEKDPLPDADNRRARCKGQFIDVSKVHRKWLTAVMVFIGVINVGVSQSVIPAAERTEEYFSLLKKKRVAVVANQTSVVGSRHLIDTLLSAKIKVRKVFAPEHGFRGQAANGEKVHSGIDPVTRLPIISLYGKHVKPTKKDLKGIDMVVFDIQDVGVRFYTYLTTLHYVMQACAENGKPLLILDRPNPNGHYIDGPVLKPGFESMVGVHPIPLVHGMTLGELAQMINGEKWLGTEDTCPLSVVTCKNWDHNTAYTLPIPPSPNLPTQESIMLYPTLGLMEGTVMSMGRGTEKPFECFGAPWLKDGHYVFVPQNIPGKAVNPPFLGDTCRGFLLSDFARNYIAGSRKLYIEWYEMLLNTCPDRQKFFTAFFDKLAGSAELRTALLNGLSIKEIRDSWKNELYQFEYKRSRYLLYRYIPGVGHTKP
jgi:uncharacterized protein YbbC (DUF1343 family)